MGSKVQTSGTRENLSTTEFNQAASQEKRSLLNLIVSSPYFSVGIVLTICAVTFGRSLGSYFLADDIGEMRYVHQIFQGNWQLFLSNFCGNYMQVPNMSVYRPVLLLTLMLDYFFWKGNPFGYYLSNLYYFSASSCLLYFFIRKLCAPWGKVRASVTGLMSACLFATNPLHCESISWVVGRVDSACCMFYLASLCCFLSTRNFVSELSLPGSKTRNKWLTTLGLLFFALGICVKEMAIGLAPVLAAIAFIFPGQETNSQSLGFAQSLKSAWQFSKPVWIATIIYFVIRVLTLGTLLGGYNGSVGASQSASALTRWVDADNWRRLLLPFSSDIFAKGNSIEHSLVFAYSALAFLLFLRFVSGSIPWRWLAFIGFWGLTQAAPIYRLWGLGTNLEGARFTFFLTLSFSSLLPVLLFAPDEKLPRKLSTRLAVCAGLLLAFLAYNMDKIAYSTNLLWLHAGKEVKAVFEDCVKLSKNCPSAEKIILLGVPKRHAGAHMILNGPTLQMLLAPPFADKEYGAPFVTLDSILFGDENLIDHSRLAALTNSPGYKGPLVWSKDAKRFIEIPLKSAGKDEQMPLSYPAGSAEQKSAPYVYGHADYNYSDGVLKVSSPKDGDGLRLIGLDLNPLAYSYLKISFQSSNNAIALPFLVRWKADNGSKNLPELAESCFVQEKLAADLKADQKEIRSIYIPLGRNWRWYAQSRISELSIFLPAVKEIKLTEISLLPADFACPSIYCATPSNSYGVLDYTQSSEIKLSTKLGEKLLLQLSKKQFFFDNLDEAQSSSAVAAEFKQAGKSAALSIPASKLDGEGYYQLRARALDHADKPIGDYSDSVTIWVAK